MVSFNMSWRMMVVTTLATLGNTWSFRINIAPHTSPLIQNELTLDKTVKTLDESCIKMSQSTGAGTRELPPLLQQMADERREFELNLGKAMDVLRTDYPNMLHTMPDFSIYHDDLNVVDPSGVQLTGLKNYKNSFRFLQTLVGLFYNTERSSVRSRMIYDFARSSIRISWNAVLVPKVLGNRRNSVYIDGISIYTMDASSGKITQHRVEQLLINNTPVRPPYGIFTALTQEFMAPGERIPVGVGAGMGAVSLN